MRNFHFIDLTCKIKKKKVKQFRIDFSVSLYFSLFDSVTSYKCQMMKILIKN